ncbi:LysR family transcriptional regulator [Paenibacillus sp. UNC451MF]|uniref:LysR family transcriptional regulator n=1 Tax=Paenibacillus sp. UNC451MF TaxID=1449063 RepID=UPI00049040C6|nr:LysR family transcriptional regulator [Paenibacillus sp. UNC451MF]
MINLEWYRIFYHTAKAGNLTKAAQELYITQPSVSYAIKQMEEAFGVKLFHRQSKGVKLTVEGQALLDYVEPSFSLLDAGESKLNNLKRLTGGELRVGASDSLFKHMLLPHLDSFHAEYPDIRIRLSHGKTPDIVHRLKEGQIDFGIVHMPIVDPQIEVTAFSVIQDCFVAGGTYKELGGSSITAEKLGALPLLLLSQGSSTRRFVEQWFAAQGITVEADIELGSIDLLVECARRGFGVAFVTRSFVQEELETGSLIELKPFEPIMPRSVGIAIRRDMPLSLAASQFLTTLKNAFPAWNDSR